MRIPLNRQSSQPVYLQIRDRIKRLIQSGTIQPGERLPSIRSLAKNVAVSPLTAIEAYSVLEGDGLIYARQGSGYYVSPEAAPANSRATFAPPQDAIIQEQNDGGFFKQFTGSIQAQAQGGLIDFSSGFPRSESSDELRRIARRAMSGANDLFRYGFPQGQLALRVQIAKLLVQQGLDVSPEELIITNGSEQALSLTLHHYLQPGDWVVVEAPTYHGALAILENLGAKIIGIPMTEQGMNLDLLRQYLHSHRPKLVYTISTLHNPTGLTTAQSHRSSLLALASQYHCPVLEDNAYEGLNFNLVPPPIKALDQEHLVTYIGTFSKTLMPGLRVGYMVVTGPSYRDILEQKLLHDLHVSTVSQAILSEYLASGYYRRHLIRLRSHNQRSRNTMLGALERYFPRQASWTVPQGGLFLWVHLPDELPLQTICQQARLQGVLVTPGAAFFPNQKGYCAMRLNFSLATEEIEKGISILGDLLHC